MILRQNIQILYNFVFFLYNLNLSSTIAFLGCSTFYLVNSLLSLARHISGNNFRENKERWFKKVRYTTGELKNSADMKR